MIFLFFTAVSTHYFIYSLDSNSKKYFKNYKLTMNLSLDEYKYKKKQSVYAIESSESEKEEVQDESEGNDITLFLKST